MGAGGLFGGKGRPILGGEWGLFGGEGGPI